MKNVLMALSLAGVFLFGTACFGWLMRKEPATDAPIPECAGLSGQARIDCEARHRGE